jgi:mRNA interferase RelE/StbE
VIEIFQTPTFKKQYKKLDKPVKRCVDVGIKEIVRNPKIGEEKKGDLAGLLVHKLKYKSQLYLLAYSYDAVTRTLNAIGVHENFYRELKRKGK